MCQQRQNTQTVFLVIALLFYPALVLVSEEGKVPEETAAQVRQASEAQVETAVALKDSFLLVDPQTGKPLSLTFDHVHQGCE